MENLNNLTREEKVSLIKQKTFKEIEEYKQYHGNLLTDFNRDEVLVATAVLALEDYLNKPDSFIEYEPYYGNYLIDDEGINIICNKNYSLLENYLDVVTDEGVEGCYHAKKLLNDKFINNQVISVIDRCIYKNEVNNAVQTKD